MTLTSPGTAAWPVTVTALSGGLATGATGCWIVGAFAIASDTVIGQVSGLLSAQSAAGGAAQGGAVRYVCCVSVSVWVPRATGMSAVKSPPAPTGAITSPPLPPLIRTAPEPMPPMPVMCTLSPTAAMNTSSP